VNTDKTPNRTSPPTLMSDGMTKREEVTNRILASLDGSSTPPQATDAPSKSKKYLTFSVFAVCGAVWLAWLSGGLSKPGQDLVAAKSSEQKIAANPIAKAPVAAAPVKPAEVSAPTSAPSDASTNKIAELQAKESAPAVITNEAPLAKMASAEPIKKSTVAAAEKTAKPAAVKTAPPAPIMIAQAPKAPLAAPAPKVQIAMADPDELNAPLKMRGAAPQAPKVIQGETIYYSSNNTELKSVVVAPTGATKNKRDADVDMLTALMVYSERQDTLLAAPAPTPSSTRGMSKKEIAERKNKPTTAALLAQCQSLGWLEGELCRLRVCEGRRGIDSACPVSSSNQSSNLPPDQTVYTNKP
jgi:hypothetical protein